MLIKIHPKNPDERNLQKVVDCLKNGGVIIYQTDTVYAIGCDINQPKAFERICKIKGIKPEKANFSIVCLDLSHISEFTKHIPTSIYKVMKKVLPGPFTFILEASKSVPKLFQSKKKTIGIRVPNHLVVRSIVEKLGNPIVSSSVHDVDKLIDYTTDPELIYENFNSKVDMVIDSGFGGIVASTVVDCSSGEIEIIREGAGSLDDL